MNWTMISKDSKDYNIELSNGEYDKQGIFHPTGIDTEDPMVIHVALKEIEKLIEQIHNMRYMIVEAIIMTKHFSMKYEAPEDGYRGKIKVIKQNHRLTQGETE